MTTHEARTLKPKTPVYWAMPVAAKGTPLNGLATHSMSGSVRVIWDLNAEPDTVVSDSDRVALSNIIIIETTNEDGTPK